MEARTLQSIRRSPQKTTHVKKESSRRGQLSGMHLLQSLLEREILQPKMVKPQTHTLLREDKKKD